MLRIRKADKSVLDLPKSALYVEVTDNAGNVVCVVGYNSINDSVTIFDSNDVELMDRYKTFFGLGDKIGNLKVIDKKMIIGK